MTAQADAFIARTSGFGNRRIAAYRALIDGLVGNGVWAKLDALYVFATLNSASALLNLVSTSWTVTNVNSLSFSADVGFTGDGNAADYLDSGFNPSTAGGLWLLNSAHYSAWNTAALANSAFALVSYGNTGPSSNIYPSYTDGHAYGRINDAQGDAGVAVSGTVGHYVINRTGASASVLYKNASSLYSPNNPSTSLTNTNLLFLAQTLYTITTASFGGGLTATDVTNLYNGLNTYMALLPFGVDPPCSIGSLTTTGFGCSIGWRAPLLGGGAWRVAKAVERNGIISRRGLIFPRRMLH